MGSFSAASYWVCPSPGLSFVRLLGKDHLQGLLLQQVNGGNSIRRAEPVDFELQQAAGEGPSAGSSVAASYWRNSIRRAFFQQAIGQNSCVIPFIIYNI